VNRLARFLALPRHRQALLLSSGWALLQAAWRVRRWPFSRLAAGLGSVTSPAAPQATTNAPLHGAPTPAAAGTTDGQAQAEAVRWAVAAWSRAWPWPPTCLMQAVAARELLVERGLPCELYFGVRTGVAGQPASAPEIGAHAWLCCGSLTVTGAAEAARFQPIAVYSFSPAAAAPRQ